MATASSPATKLLQRLDPGTYKLCDTYFAVPRCIVDGYYPPGTFTLSELRRLIHLYYRRNIDYGTSTAGHKEFTKLFGHIKEEDFGRIQQSLVSRGFVGVDKSWGKTTQYSIFVPPIYNAAYDELVSLYPNKVYNSNTIDRLGNFIKVPSEIVTEGILSKRYAHELDFNEVILLLKLYRHNALDVYGGVDYCFLKSQKQQLVVNKSLYLDINLTKEEFNIALNGLLNRGLVSFVDILTEQFRFDKEIEMLCYAADASARINNGDLKQLSILRPYFQPPLTDNEKLTGRHINVT